jgi:hypothetical protein
MSRLLIREETKISPPTREDTEKPLTKHGWTHAYGGEDPIPDHSIDPRQIKALGMINAMMLLPSVGTGGQYGIIAFAMPSDSEKSLVPLVVKFTVQGAFQSGETVTIRITTVFKDGSTHTVTKSVTEPGTITLNIADLLPDHYSFNKYIQRIEVAAASSAPTTMVSVRGFIYTVEL